MANCFEALMLPLVVSAGGEAEEAGDRPPKHTLTQRLARARDGSDACLEEIDIGWCQGRAKRYYDNINAYAPDMTLVFTVDQSKAEWYVYRKRIAEVLEWRDEEGEKEGERQIASIKLSFTPDFRKFNDTHIRRNFEYFQQTKDNVCVLCSGDSALVRFAVVPMTYRKCFPSVYMSHNSYDLLLLCTSCFARSRGVYDAERQSVAEDYGIPLAHLTPARLVTYEKELAAIKAQLANSPESTSGPAEDDFVDHHVSPHLRLKVMKEYANIERHRACLLVILKYAKALHCHYINSGEDTGEPIFSGRSFIIPEAKVHAMREYLDENAPRYPLTGADVEQWASEKGSASSPAGVRVILPLGRPRAGIQRQPLGKDDGNNNGEERDGTGGGRSETTHVRRLLTEYWLRENPHIRAFIPRTVHNEADEEAPMVDSHAFLIVRLLMEKYAGSSGRNGEHAVGQFIYRWRRLFLDKIRPQHLPKWWVAEDGILRL